MPEDPLAIRIENERRIINIEAKLGILEERLLALKDRHELTNTKIEEIQEIFSRLKDKDVALTYNISKLENDLEDLEKEIIKLAERVEKIGENDFLKFTADFDIKKLLVLIITLVSLITSPSILTTVLQDQEEEKAEEKVERLIRLLEEQGG